MISGSAVRTSCRHRRPCTADDVPPHREGSLAGQELGAGEKRDGKGLLTDEGTSAGEGDRRGPTGQPLSLQKTAKVPCWREPPSATTPPAMTRKSLSRL